MVRFDVDVLEALRLGKGASVIEPLEARVDAGLADLSKYHDYVPPSLRSATFYDHIAVARTYRATHPGPFSSGPVADAVKKTLSLRPPDAPTKN
jgi:hypothetical protein